MSLRIDWTEVQQTRPVVLARRMDISRVSGGVLLPGRSWKTPAGEGANYMFEGPSVQVRARLIPRGHRGQLFQVFTDASKGGRGLGRIRLSSSAAKQVEELEHAIYGRIIARDAPVKDCNWSGVQSGGILDVDVLCDGEEPYVSLPEGGFENVPAQGVLCDVVVGLHRIVVNHSRGTARPVWVLLGVRKHVSSPSDSDTSSSDSEKK